MTPQPRPSRSARLRGYLAGAEPVTIMEAHDALSARIVESAGLPAIWASGLSISAAMGLRDCNEASVTQVLDVLELMADAVDLPILVDGDTGFGNFNNARRLVRKLEQRGLAGVVIEDKLFPKSNSFVGDGQPLAGIEELTGKLAAMLDARTDPDFCVVARTEALVSGFGLDEALRRAEAYRRAGADAILIHSKRSTADEVLAFAARWERRAPLIAVPTTYVTTPPARLHAAGIATVIYANQNLRAAIAAMTRACERVRAEGGAAALEAEIAPLARVFELTRTPELTADEQRYLPASSVARGVVIARAGVDADAVRRTIAALGAAEVRPTTVVGVAGAHPFADVEYLAADGVITDARAIALAASRHAGPVVVALADLRLADHTVPALRATPGDLVALVDPCKRGVHPWAVAATDAPGGVHVLAASPPGRDDPCIGRFMGVVRASAAGAAQLRAQAERAADADLLALLRQLATAGHPVRLLLLADAASEAAVTDEPGRR